MMPFSPASRRGAVLLLSILLLLPASACHRQSASPGSDPVTSSAVTQPTQTGSATRAPEPEIGISTFDKTYSAADGTKLLSLSYALPKVENAGDESSLCMINAYYESEMQNLVNAGQGELLESVQTAAQSGMFLAPYLDEENYTEEYRSDSRISFLRTHSSYTGGAHPNYVLISDNFDYTSGLRLTAADFFKVPAETYTARILEEILSQIKTNGPENYMDGYQDVLPHIFNPDQFYLTEKGFVFYFQPYDIAPYAAGAPSFPIPFSDLEDILKPWI